MKRSLLAAVLLASSLNASIPAYRVIDKLPAGDGGWDLLRVAAADQRVYVARSDGVTAIDLNTGKATDRLVPGQHVHAALAIPGSHEVLSTNGETNTAVLFDGRTGAIRATIATGTKPDAAAYDPATRTIWIMNPGSGDVTVVDLRSAKAVATVPVGGSLEMGEADGRGHLYVNVEDKNQVAILDTVRRKLERRFPLQGCQGPTGLAIDAAANEILSACGNAIAVISAPDGHQLAQLPIGKGADGAVFDPVHHVFLVPAGRDGNVTVIRPGTSPSVIAQVPTAVSARTIAVDPSTGDAYVPAAELAPAPAGQRPKPLPGTFRVLVLGP